MKISTLIKNARKPFCSLEFFPPKERQNWPQFFETVKKLAELKPLFVSVTYGAGGSTQDNTLAITAHLKNELGLEPMAHLTCVGASEDGLRSFLEELGKANVDNILALRGDPPRGSAIDWEAMPFRHASDLVRFVRRNFPDLGIAVAGYPAPHPESKSFREDRRFTRKKIKAGAEAVITQMFFDVREYTDFVDRLRAKGVDTPVVPGIMPIQSLESLRKVLSLCDAHLPGKLYFTLEKIQAEQGPEAVKKAGIDFVVDQICQLLDAGAPGVHLYTLNRAETCLAIIREVRKRGYDI